jgi:hypothetical protein
MPSVRKIDCRNAVRWGVVACMALSALGATAGRAVGHHVVSVPNKHPLSIVSGDVYVNRFRATMRLICSAEELELLQGLEASEDGVYDPEEIKDATKDHADYLAEKITVRDVNGELLKPRIREIIDIKIPESGIVAGQLMLHEMVIVLEFDYEEPPEFITLQQDMIAEGQLLPSEFHVLMKQAGSDTPYEKMLKPQQPETFQFDWDRPALNKDDSPEAWKDWFDQRREKMLGIESYGSIYSFIYVTDREVRHEVLVPLATLATLIDIERADESFLEIAEQEAAAKKIAAYFGAVNPVTIDGISVKPVFDRIDFYGLDLRDFAVQAEKRKVSMASGRVGVIMAYGVKKRPTEVTVQWNLFNDLIRQIDSVAIAYDSVQKVVFSKFRDTDKPIEERNVYRWQAPDRQPLPAITGLEGQYKLTDYENPTITVPWVTVAAISVAVLLAIVGWVSSASKLIYLAALVVMVGGLFGYSLGQVEHQVPFASARKFQISEADATDVFARLHANMFRSFDYRDEADVYDALEKSVSGELLRELYLQINESLRIQEQGGAVAVIDKVNFQEGQLHVIGGDSKPASPVHFVYRSKWSLSGTIEHWGHIHQRENSYQATFTVELVDGAWKLTRMSDQDFEPGVVKTNVRTF